MQLICYSTETEKIWLKFWPCQCDENISWENWHQCSDPLTIYETDYSKLLLPYFQMVFPLADPTNGEIQESFDVCSENWIDKNAWQTIMCAIEANMTTIEKERIFYHAFYDWIQEQLKKWDIIEIEGNQ